MNGLDHSAPLQGVVICCTSIPDEKRTQVAEWAHQLGAVHRYDLTLDVTHLIIGDHKTEKYRYVARERNDVLPMTIEWLEAVRELWINDREIDLEALEQKYVRPVFHGLRFSMTGCEDPVERFQVAELVKAKGAIYEGDLTKHITHLISFRTEGAKYKAAKKWKLDIVSVEWLHHCAERGMILDERLYDPALPIEERGRGAWDRSKTKRTSLGKRPRVNLESCSDSGQRKLRRTASTKLNSQRENMWGDIVTGGSFAQVNRSGIWEAEGDVSELNQAEPKHTEVKTDTTQATSDDPPRLYGIFSRCRFLLYGFTPAKTEVLHSHLISNDAEVAMTANELLPVGESSTHRLFRIVPHDLPIAAHPDLPSRAVVVHTVTLWWVERCLHHKKFMEPTAHMIGQPFPTFPIAGFSSPKAIISSSAFAGIDLLHLTRAVELIGASYSEDFTPRSSVLVTNSMTAIRKDKFDHAQEWNVPIVTSEWLWDSISAGSKLPMAKYRCRSHREKLSLPIPAPTALEEVVPKLEDDHDGRPETESSNANLPLRRDCPPVMGNPFMQSPSPSVKSEPVTQANGLLHTSTSSTSQDPPNKSEPLSERSQNISSPTRTLSTAPQMTDRPVSRAQEERSEELSTTLADLVAKAKKSAQPEPTKRRGIMGRVASNLSNTSRSRETSVDSTATHGHPVQYPDGRENDQTANERIRQLMTGDRRVVEEDSQPSNTQLEYRDPESTIAQEMVAAKLRGEKVDMAELRRGRQMEKSITVGNFMAKEKPARRRTMRAGTIGK